MIDLAADTKHCKVSRPIRGRQARRAAVAPAFAREPPRWGRPRATVRERKSRSRVSVTRKMPALVALLAKVPGLPVVLDHLGKPPVSGDADGWERDLCDLAALPRVSVKLSGVAPEASPRGGTIRRQALPWLAVALDAFGAERCMVGSDWPVSAVSVGREAPAGGSHTCSTMSGPRCPSAMISRGGRPPLSIRSASLPDDQSSHWGLTGQCGPGFVHSAASA
jgi:predicted TIM-barrel fold metal-dependent hydrolase